MEKLYISVPSNRDWKGRFGGCLSGLMNDCISPGSPFSTSLLRAWGQSSCLSIARQIFVDEMIKEGYTYWLSLDDDMTFPPDIARRLLAHGKDIVTVNTRRKTHLIQGSLVAMDGSNLVSQDKTGLEEVRAMGGAIFLAKIEAFKHIPRPHFQVVWSEDHQAYVSEDVYFAALLRAHGLKLWCDHDLSQEIGHIGEYEYKWSN